MVSNSRRVFLLKVAAVAPALAVASAARAAAEPLDPKDAQAQALGYVPDTHLADQKKYPKHTDKQHCGVCQLYGGAAGSATGPCPIFAGRLVSSKGWCSSWIQKVG